MVKTKQNVRHGFKKKSSKSRLTRPAFFIVLAGLVAWMISCNENKEVKEQPIQKQSSFVGSNSCQSCHSEVFQKWEGSHHDLAMQEANSSTVLADFNNAKLTYHGVTSTFFQKNGDYYVNTQGPDGDYHDYKIAYTYGITPLQQYIAEFPDGAYQCLQTAWDTEKGEWYDLQPTLDIKPDEWIHWSHGGMRWNTMCADCHSTDVKKNFDARTESFQTSFSEINVGCESCHGPSSEHVSSYQTGQKNYHAPEMYMDKNLSSQDLVEKCARCHSRRSQITNGFDFEEEFLDHYSPALLTQPNYQGDGQIQGEVYVYGSFLQSKMYHNDVSCRDCHDVHSLKLKAEGNQLCLSCHEPKYDKPSHHFHEQNSLASQCINCHMTGETYMGNDFRRDHSFRIPRPDQSVKYGTKNACTGCHTDKSDQWAMDAVIANYGPNRVEHFSDFLLAGNEGDQAAFLQLMANGNHPTIARATALSQYADYAVSATELDVLLEYLNDPEPLIRFEALKSLSGVGYPNLTSEVAPLLMDSMRSVRIAAAEYINKLDESGARPKGFSAANAEYLTSLDVNADFATGQLQIALYENAQGNTEKAIAALEKAVELDNYFNPARMNLALLYYQNGRIREAETTYLKVTELEPEFGEAYYMLGLLYNEIAEIEKAKSNLRLACDKNPPNPNAYYNLSLMMQGEGDYGKSASLLKEGLKKVPNNERLLYALLIAEVELSDIANAKETCMSLIEIAPQNPNYPQFLERINAELNQLFR